MFKTDCFAYINEKKCFALNDMNCEGCSFYKPVEDSDKARKQIIKDCKNYASATERNE